ncbi:matrix metalloproteinase-28-like isoform X2 [Salvelinus namaycush]|uniref:Matrix metalloproteinase-28-like isoform X2 n=1 Tax=Salvelinus namaycush TaxID=8040 RepID=A0A8U1ETG3_SALNM|nr:matrix metalloproteinase-28-like isoform X2 [Salvelinus namaycush]XP_038861312.1 matrix metalloproteinase-28-like isoform X2 [Salvelinus namaycush]
MHQGSQSDQIIQLPGQVFSSALQDWELSQGCTGEPDSTPPPYCRGFFDAITMGRRVWCYSGSDVDPGFPLRSSELGLPGHPDQAFTYPHLGHLVVFKGQRYFVLNFGTLRPDSYYPAAWKTEGQRSPQPL